MMVIEARLRDMANPARGEPANAIRPLGYDIPFRSCRSARNYGVANAKRRRAHPAA